MNGATQQICYDSFLHFGLSGSLSLTGLHCQDGLLLVNSAHLRVKVNKVEHLNPGVSKPCVSKI